MKIASIFAEISNVNSTNEKMRILSKYKDNEILKQVLYLIYSKRIKFYIKQIPEYDLNTLNEPKLSLSEVLELLKTLSNRTYTGDAARDRLKYILENVSYDDAYVIERIIDKDAKIGMGSTNINKVFKDLIEKTPYMGATSYSKKVVDKLFEENEILYSQVKMDGRYCNAIIDNGDVILESRSGEITSLENSKLYSQLKRWGGDDSYVLNGELIIYGIDRYKANGIINSLVTIGDKIKQGIDVLKEINKFNKENPLTYLEALEQVVFVVWDMITLDEYYNKKSDRAYSHRLSWLQVGILANNFSQIKLIKTEIVKTHKEALNHFKELLAKGEEGTILKSPKGKWKDGKPKYQVKFKIETHFDLEIYNFQYGTRGTKNEHLITSVLVQSSCGKLKTKAAGLKESEMKYVTENQKDLLGTVLTVKSCGISSNTLGEYALLHPSFIQLRDDKTIADSLEDCFNIENATLNLNS